LKLQTLYEISRIAEYIFVVYIFAFSSDERIDILSYLTAILNGHKRARISIGPAIFERPENPVKFEVV
jgi:hypothetical protein